MTISSAIRKAGPFAGNGVTTVFPFSFKVFSADDVVATLMTVATGIEQTITNYTVALNADQNASPGGSVTYTPSGAPMTSAYTLTLTSAVEELQGTDLVNGGAFHADTVEDALDRGVILTQQLAEQLSRAFRFPISVTGVDPDIVPFTANGYLRVKADGSGLETVSAVLDSGNFLLDATAVTRTVGSKLASVVNVMDFIPNNLWASIEAHTITSALDTYLQKAIDYTATRGKRLWWEYGRFPFNTLNLSAYTVRGGGWEGEGGSPFASTAATELAYLGAGTGITLTDFYDFYIRNMLIATDYGFGSQGSVGMVIQGCTRPYIEGVHLQGFLDFGFKLLTTANGSTVLGRLLNVSANDIVNGGGTGTGVYFDSLHGGKGVNSNKVDGQFTNCNRGAHVADVNCNDNKLMGDFKSTVANSVGIKTAGRSTNPDQANVEECDTGIEIENVSGASLNLGVVHFNNNNTEISNVGAKPIFGQAQRSTDQAQRHYIGVTLLDIASAVAGKELPLPANRTVTGAANNGSGAIRITTNGAHGYSSGDAVNITGVTGTTEANGDWVVTFVAYNQFDLNGSTFVGAWISGGTVTFRGFSPQPTGSTTTTRAITNCANNGSGLIRVTSVGHGYATSDKVRISSVKGTHEANSSTANQSWTVTVIDADNFDLQGSAFTNTYTSGGTAIGVPTLTAYAVRATRFGNQVRVSINLTWNRAPTMSGNLEIDLGEFIPPSVSFAGHGQPLSVWHQNLTLPGASTQLVAYVKNNSRKIALEGCTSGAANAAVAVDTSASVIIGGVYECADGWLL